MPDIVITNPPPPPDGTPSFGGTGEVGIAPILNPKVPIGKCSRQVLGLMPMTICVNIPNPDCRDAKPHPMDCGYITPVFADLSDLDGFKNDFTTMTMDKFTTSGLLQVEWFLDKCDSAGNFIQVAVLDGTSLGNFFDSLAFVGLPTYTEILLLWNEVLAAHGSGIYQIRTKSTLDMNLFCEQCSEPFCLKRFDCALANGTVRWTVGYGAGTIGSIDDPNITFGTPSVNLYQIRVRGGFGDETSEYEEITQEYQNGLQVKIRDEAIQKYMFKSARVPNWFHDRFKAYALMAPSLRVDDYNLNNPSYDIKLLRVIRDGNYEPERNPNSRLTKVSVNFKEGIQNVEARKC